MRILLIALLFTLCCVPPVLAGEDDWAKGLEGEMGSFDVEDRSSGELDMAGFDQDESGPSWGGGKDLQGELRLFIGRKYLADNDWEPVEEQNEYGLGLGLKGEGWPVSVTLSYRRSEIAETVTLGGLDTDLMGETVEMALGVRWERGGAGQFRPFLGGGLCRIEGSIEAKSSAGSLSDSAVATGLFVEGGLLFMLNSRVDVGIEARYSKAETRLYGTDVEAGGLHVGLGAGVRW